MEWRNGAASTKLNDQTQVKFRQLVSVAKWNGGGTSCGRDGLIMKKLFSLQM
jgi:hypothetical protein